MVKSFILSLNFARSLKKDRSNRSLFDIIPTNDVENDENVAAGVDENVEREIPSILNKNVSNFRAQGFSVDDNNEPAPEIFRMQPTLQMMECIEHGEVNPWMQGGWLVSKMCSQH
jgi:hypothetical protein